MSKINGFEAFVQKWADSEYGHGKGPFMISAKGFSSTYLHDDGKWYNSAQQFATREEAQAVIDRCACKVLDSCEARKLTSVAIRSDVLAAVDKKIKEASQRGECRVMIGEDDVPPSPGPFGGMTLHKLKDFLPGMGYKVEISYGEYEGLQTHSIHVAW